MSTSLRAQSPKVVEAIATGVVLGKLPLRADFLPHPVYDSLLDHLDELFRNGLQTLHKNAVDEAFTQLTIPILLIREKNKFFIGELLGSHDRSGRLYPLVSGVLCTDSNEDFALSPLVFEVALTSIDSLMRDARANSDEAYGLTRFLAKYTEGLYIPDDIGLARALINERLKTKVTSVLSQWVGSRAKLHAFLLNLLFWCDFQSRYSMTELCEFIALPMPAGEDRLMAATLWLQTLITTMPSQSEKLLAYTYNSGGQEYFHVFIGEPNTNALEGMFQRSTNIFNLTSESDVWKNHQSYSEIDFALRRLLENESLPMATLMVFLSKARDVIAGRRANF